MTEALTRREPEDIIDPKTGELVDVRRYPHTDLIDVLLELRDHEQQFREWRIRVEDELVRRHGDRRAAQVIGDYEIDVDRGWQRVWDPDQLTEVRRELLEDGLVTAADVLGVVESVRKVDGRKAQALLNRLDGEALQRVRECFHWEQKGRARVKVTPVVQLEP